MKEIHLTRGKIAIVDGSDFSSVSRYSWVAQWDGYNWYASRKVGKRRQSMHVFLMRPPKGVIIDHRDRNGLNNRRKNLRICLHAQNVSNQRLRRDSKSGLKGVSWKIKNRRWCAQICNRQHVIHLGLFKDKISAAKAYDEAAVKFFGEFACTNKDLGLLKS